MVETDAFAAIASSWGWDDTPLDAILSDVRPSKARPADSPPFRVDGKAQSLLSSFPYRDLPPDPMRSVYLTAVALSRKTRGHTLCCTSTVPGEVPVTRDEIRRAAGICARQSRHHPKAHHLCRKWILGMAKLNEGQRRCVRRLVALQSPGIV